MFGLLPVFSENENWISYTSEKDMQGSYAIYINRFPEMNEEIRISSGGGEEPKWLPDGSGIYFSTFPTYFLTV